MRIAAIVNGSDLSWATQSSSEGTIVRISDAEQRFLVVGGDQGTITAPHPGEYTLTVTSGTETQTRTITI